MKLHDDYVLYDFGDEVTLVPVGKAAEHFHGILRANKTAGVILNCLKEDTTEEAIVAALEERFEGERDYMAATVSQLLDHLRQRGALVE